MASESDLTGLRRARRILVLGSPGAGKTLLSTFLSRHLGLELLRLDDFFWQPGQVRLPTDEWRALVAELARRPVWVMDGTYEASLDLRAPAADAIVYLQSNRWVCLWRVVLRRLVSRWQRLSEPSRGHALTPFFVRYVLQFPAVTQPEVLRLIARHGNGAPLIWLDGARGVGRLIHQFEHEPPGVEPDNGAAQSQLAEPQPHRRA